MAWHRIDFNNEMKIKASIINHAKNNNILYEFLKIGTPRNLLIISKRKSKPSIIEIKSQ